MSILFQIVHRSLFVGCISLCCCSGLFAQSTKKAEEKSKSKNNAVIKAFSGVSPQDVVVVGDGFWVASGTGKVLKGWKKDKVSSYTLKFTPVGIVGSGDEKNLYLSDGVDAVHVFSIEKGKVVKSLPVGYQPGRMVLLKDGKTLCILNSLAGKATLLNTESGATQEVILKREPRAVAMNPITGQVAVANLLPTQASTAPYISAEVSLFDPAYPGAVKHIGLANGSQSLEGIAYSPDGKYVYVTHLISRFQYPVTQVERGWINTNALSIIDVEKGEYKGSVLLDAIDRGAANPRGMVLSADGNVAYIALAGTHELLSIDLKGVFERLEKVAWNPKVTNDLTFVNDLIKRMPVDGLSPREVRLVGTDAYVPCYFSGNVSVIDTMTGAVKDKKVVEKAMPMKGTRRGEFLFADAGICFQNWQSCLSCHPDGRADGLNWDQQNDGIGNPKNTKTMVFSHVTPPSMITGIRSSAELAVRKGIMHTLFASVSEEDAAAVDEYLKALRPAPSPFLEKGKLSESAKRGEAVYTKALCIQCHSGEYLTDKKAYDVGTGLEEYKGFAFDTPMLREIWRTAPYLYDGRAGTLREVLVDFNKEDKHGKTSDLTEQELKDLEQYLLTL